MSVSVLFAIGQGLVRCHAGKGQSPPSPCRLWSLLAPNSPLQLCADRPQRSPALGMTQSWRETLERAIALEAATVLLYAWDLWLGSPDWQATSTALGQLSASTKIFDPVPSDPVATATWALKKAIGFHY